MTNEFPPGFEIDAKTIGVDFDGVLHNNNRGFFDGTCYGDPIPDGIAAIKELSKDFNIVIFTAKAKADRPIIDGKTGSELVWDWLERHGIKEYVQDVTAEKPRSCLYIDDKGYRFENWKDTLTFIKSRQWY